MLDIIYTVLGLAAVVLVIYGCGKVLGLAAWGHNSTPTVEQQLYRPCKLEAGVVRECHGYRGHPEIFRYAISCDVHKVFYCMPSIVSALFEYDKFRAYESVRDVRLFDVGKQTVVVANEVQFRALLSIYHSYIEQHCCKHTSKECAVHYNLLDSVLCSKAIAYKYDNALMDANA